MDRRRARELDETRRDETRLDWTDHHNYFCLSFISATSTSAINTRSVRARARARIRIRISRIFGLSHISISILLATVQYVEHKATERAISVPRQLWDVVYLVGNCDRWQRSQCSCSRSCSCISQKCGTHVQSNEHTTIAVQTRHLTILSPVDHFKNVNVSSCLLEHSNGRQEGELRFSSWQLAR